MNDLKYDIAAIGELLVDLAYCGQNAGGWPALQAAPGGAPANFLAAAAAAGSRTAFIGKVGDDAFGYMLKKELKGTGTDVSGLIVDPDVFTTLAFVTLDEEGERSFSFARKPGADICLRPEEVRMDIIDSAKALHFGSLSLTDEPARSAVKEAVLYAKASGKLITFDPNWREPLWSSADAAREQILWGLRQADAVKISEEEVTLLWDCGAEEGLDRLLSDFGVKLAWVTLGAKGCVFGNQNARGRASYQGDLEAVDTTGAGDIFGGTAVSCLLKCGRAPEELSYEELCQGAVLATAAASISVTRPGGMSSVSSAAETVDAAGHCIHSRIC